LLRGVGLPEFFAFLELCKTGKRRARKMTYSEKERKKEKKIEWVVSYDSL